jgi:hypothetical protein
MINKLHFYFKGIESKDNGIIPLRLLNLNIFRSFHTRYCKEYLISTLNEMVYFKFECRQNCIKDYEHEINKEEIRNILRRISPQEDEIRDRSQIFIIISENSFNNSDLETKKMLERIFLIRPASNTFLFIVNFSNNVLEFENNRIVFSSLDLIISPDFSVDILTTLIEHSPLRTNFHFIVPAKELWGIPNSLIGIFLFPFVIPFWSVYNFLKIKVMPFNTGTIIRHKNDKTQFYGVAFRDNKYLYISRIKNAKQFHQDFAHQAPIVGKIPIKNNNFIALNWMET